MENSIHMSKVGCLVFTIDEDIIKENEDKITKKMMEDMISSPSCSDQ